VSETEYGYRARRVSPNAGERWPFERVASGLDSAQELAASAVTEEPGWEAEVIVRDAAGEWRKYEPEPRPADGEDDGLSPQVMSDLLSLVEETVIPPEVIATWTPAERVLAARWAGAEYGNASDVPVRRLPEPGFVTRAAEICGSPALAQLAVEAWTGRPSAHDYAESPEKLAAMAQEAITGLIVLGLRVAGGKERA
jgi:hypothetical protein